MTTTVKAAVAWRKGEPLVIETLQLRDPGPGEVLVEMKASGLCHTDLSVIEGKFPAPFPIIPGHEGAGRVIGVGEGSTSLGIGAPVIINNLPHCGHCAPCLSGRTNYCDQLAANRAKPSAFSKDGEPVGTMGGVASFATHTVIGAERLTAIPDTMPLESAALVPCGVMTGVGAALFTAQVHEGASVVVFGMGSIGLSAVQAARLAKAAHIVAIDTNPAKETIARRFGATAFLNPRQLDMPLEEAVRTVLGGLADYAFECVGNVDVLSQALALVQPFWGVCIAVGLAPLDQRITLPASAFWFGRTLRGTFIGDGNPITDTGKILDWYRSGELEIDELVTHRFPLDEINAGFEAMKRGEAIRSVIVY